MAAVPNLPAPGVLPPLQLGQPQTIATTNTMQVSTYAQWYSESSNDPHRDNYTPVLQAFAAGAGVNINVQPAELLEQVLGNTQGAQAFVVLATTMNGNRVFVIHRLSHYLQQLGGLGTPWDGLVFATKGDITHGMVHIVQFPVEAFHQTVDVTVATVQAVTDALTQAPLVQHLGPHAVGDPDTELVRTRNVMYLPARYASLLMASQGVTPRQAWEILVPQMQQEGTLIKCQVLVDWLGVALMLRPNNGAPANLRLASAGVAGDDDLAKHRKAILSRDLPGRYQQVGLEAAIWQLAHGVAQGTQETREHRLAQDEERSKPKLPSQRWPATLRILMEYLNISSEADLPGLWHALAQTDKKFYARVMQDQAEEHTRSADRYVPHAAVISVQLGQDLVNFKFAGTNPDNINCGLQPFAVAFESDSQREATLETAKTYSLLAEGSVGVDLADLEALKAKDIRNLPTTFFMLELCLGSFGNLLNMVLGVEHKLTTAYKAFWELLTRL